MTTESLFQMGICLNCPTETLQCYLYGIDQCTGPVLEGGRVSGYANVETLSLFQCNGCEAVLFFSTMLEGECGYSVEDIVEFDPKTVTELDRHTFLDLSTRLYSTPSIYPANEEKSFLDPLTPTDIRSCYDIGKRVRAISNDLYALQLRKTLEAICKDLGASDRLQSGKRAMLWQQIDHLGEQNLVGEFICKAAHELKDISNTGAHYSDRPVTDTDVRKLENLLALITNYVYGS